MRRKRKAAHPPEQRATGSEQRGGGVQVPGALPPLHSLPNSSELGGSQEPAPAQRDLQPISGQCCAQPHSTRGAGGILCPAPAWLWDPTVLQGPTLGALAPPSLVPLRERLCLTNSAPPQAPGSLWWAKGTDRSPGRPPRTATFPCALGGHSPPFSAQTQEWGHGRKCATQGKSP